MPATGQADESLLDRGGTPSVVEHQLEVGPRPDQQAAQLRSGRVVANHAANGDPGFEPREHVGHIGRAAQACLAPRGAQHDHRCFLADPLGIAPGVTVENQVAQHQNLGVAQLFQHAHQVM